MVQLLSEHKVLLTHKNQTKCSIFRPAPERPGHLTVRHLPLTPSLSLRPYRKSQPKIYPQPKYSISCDVLKQASDEATKKYPVKKPDTGEI